MMRSFTQTSFIIFVIIFIQSTTILSLFPVSIANAAEKDRCFSAAKNRRDLNGVVDNFHELIKSEKYIGQNEAVSVVGNMLGEYVTRMKNKMNDSGSSNNKASDSQGPFLSFHFVGPSGSGKSFMAEIIAKSLFYPYDCQAWSLSSLGIRSCPSYGEMVDSWLQMCGVVRVAFNKDEDDGGKNKMEKALTRAAGMLKGNQNDGIIMIFDDVNFCTGSCLGLLIDLFETKTIEAANGERYSIKQSIAILTSDLSKEGIPTPDSIIDFTHYAIIKTKILEKAKEFWAKKSPKSNLFLVTSTLVPFVQLNRAELHELISSEIVKLGFEINKKINVAMKKKDIEKVENEEKNNFFAPLLKLKNKFINRLNSASSYYKWIGRFHFKQDIIDEILQKVDLTGDARDITVELKPLFVKLLIDPSDIGERLLKQSSTIRDGDTIIFRDDVVLKIKKLEELKSLHPLERLHLEITRVNK